MFRVGSFSINPITGVITAKFSPITGPNLLPLRMHSNVTFMCSSLVYYVVYIKYIQQTALETISHY
jgi:uncharacterized ion transporter superfamily protein YfcC